MCGSGQDTATSSEGSMCLGTETADLPQHSVFQASVGKLGSESVSTQWDQKRVSCTVTLGRSRRYEQKGSCVPAGCCAVSLLGMLLSPRGTETTVASFQHGSQGVILHHFFETSSEVCDRLDMNIKICLEQIEYKKVVGGHFRDYIIKRP